MHKKSHKHCGKTVLERCRMHKSNKYKTKTAKNRPCQDSMDMHKTRIYTKSLQGRRVIAGDGGIGAVKICSGFQICVGADARVRNDLDGTRHRERCFLSSELVSSFPDRKPRLQSGFCTGLPNLCRGRCPHRPAWEPSDSPQGFAFRACIPPGGQGSSVPTKCSVSNMCCRGRRLCRPARKFRIRRKLP